MLIDTYCPCCGTWQNSASIDILPGMYEWTCPNCETKWNIEIQFKEI